MSDEARHFLGFVEAIAGRRVSGWCICPAAPMEKVELVLLLRGIPAARGFTELTRADVAAQHGCHAQSGFAFTLEAEAREADIQLLPLGADAPLPRLQAVSPAPTVSPPAAGKPVAMQAAPKVVLELDETGWIRAEPFPFA